MRLKGSGVSKAEGEEAMAGDEERIRRVREEIRLVGLDAVVCRLPHNVLMLSGYWPVLADSTLVFPLEGEPVLIVPEGEEVRTESGWVDDVRTFKPVTLEKLSDSVAETLPILTDVAHGLRLNSARIGYEGGLDSMPASYAEVIAPLPYIEEMYRRAFRGSELVDATETLRSLRKVKTAYETGRIRLAHEIAAFGIEAAKRVLRPGLRESELAAVMHGAIVGKGVGHRGAGRVGAYTFAMSGPNGSRAHLQFQQTSDRVIEWGDFVLVHINSYADGYWTDVTRTFVVGVPDDRQRRIYAAVLDGIEAGLGAIREGARAAEVDGVARRVLEERGYGEEFNHGM